MKRKAANKLGKRILTNLFATKRTALQEQRFSQTEARPAERVRLKRNEKVIESFSSIKKGRRQMSPAFLYIVELL